EAAVAHADGAVVAGDDPLAGVGDDADYMLAVGQAARIEIKVIRAARPYRDNRPARVKAVVHPETDTGEPAEAGPRIEGDRHGDDTGDGLVTGRARDGDAGGDGRRRGSRRTARHRGERRCQDAAEQRPLTG